MSPTGWGSQSFQARFSFWLWDVQAALLAWLWPDLQLKAPELATFAALVTIVFAGLLWRSWPGFLMPGGGADLTHHLQLVDYLDRHWRLVHEPRVEAYLGEMVHYTPGAHLLASLLGRWTGRDGFHAVYFVVALSVAVKAGFVFLTDTEVTLRPPVTDPVRARRSRPSLSSAGLLHWLLRPLFVHRAGRVGDVRGRDVVGRGRLGPAALVACRDRSSASPAPACSSPGRCGSDRR